MFWVGFPESIRHDGTNPLHSVTFKTTNPGSSASRTFQRSLRPFHFWSIQGRRMDPPSETSTSESSCGSPRKWRTKAPPTSSPSSRDISGTGTAVTSEFPQPASEMTSRSLNVMVGSIQLWYENSNKLLFFCLSDTTTAWTPSVTTTCSTSSPDVKWPRDTRPVFAWRTRAVIPDSDGATPVHHIHRLINTHTNTVPWQFVKPSPNVLCRIHVHGHNFHATTTFHWLRESQHWWTTLLGSRF